MKEYNLKTSMKVALGMVAVSFLVACTPPASQLKKVIEENPDIVFNAIEKHPTEFFQMLEKAGQAAREQSQSAQFEEELSRIKTELKSPAALDISADRAIGSDSAPVTIVEYSDYNCGHCAHAHETMKALKEQYGDKIRFVFKNLPILAPSSKTAAEYAEAVAMQDKEKGYEFHSLIFENQAELRDGAEKFLVETAKKVGADVAKMKKDAKSDAVAKRIKSDVDEARKFEFSGTPGFMVNGAAIHGAYPLEFFKNVVDFILAEKGGSSDKK